MRLFMTVVSIGLFLTLSVVAEAHHSAVNFWFTDREVEIEGVVMEVKMVNPHPELVLEVTEPNGETSVWRISGGGHATGMIRGGWRQDTLPAGMKVKVSGKPFASGRCEGPVGWKRHPTGRDGGQFLLRCGAHWSSGISIVASVDGLRSTVPSMVAAKAAAEACMGPSASALAEFDSVARACV